MNLQAMHDLTKARMKSGAAIARDVRPPAYPQRFGAVLPNHPRANGDAGPACRPWLDQNVGPLKYTYLYYKIGQ
jgi:hypothetical protein